MLSMPWVIRDLTLIKYLLSAIRSSQILVLFDPSRWVGSPPGATHQQIWWITFQNNGPNQLHASQRRKPRYIYRKRYTLQAQTESYTTYLTSLQGYTENRNQTVINDRNKLYNYEAHIHQDSPDLNIIENKIIEFIFYLPKITDGTNGEMYTLFRGVCQTLKTPKKIKNKKGL